jgi:predicted metal-dependent HD superfamily phosphohydrolase
MTIQFDQEGFGGVGARKIRWDELEAVGIRTTADGPLLEDVFWQFVLPDGVLELPGAWVDGAALAVMQRQLGGLDSLKIVRAMGSTDERIFRVWHAREPASRGEVVCAARFAALVGRLGGDASAADDVFRRLRDAWAAEERRYHDVEHLADCLHELDGARVAPELRDVAELAVWYHDAIYQPLARDNEARSAALLDEDAARLGIPRERALVAAGCVCATAHLAGAAPREPAADLVIDADLSILGRDALRFMEFEYAVAEEYAAVSRTRFIVGRGRFLDGLLASPSIFRSEGFRALYEARARANIAALLDSPRYRAWRWLGRFWKAS